MRENFPCMCVCALHGVSREGTKSPGNGVTNGFEPLCEHQESNWGPLAEQLEL